MASRQSQPVRVMQTGKTYRILLVIFLSVVLPIGIFLAMQLRFSADLQAFLPTGDVEYEQYQNDIAHFGQGNPQMIIGISHDENIFTLPFLQQLLSFEKALMNTEGVVFANSVASLQNPVRGLVRVRERPFIRVENPEYYSADTTAFFQYPDVYPKFVSPDRKSVCVFVQLDTDLPVEFAATIRKLTKEAGFEDCYYYGLPIVEDSYRKSVERDALVLSLVAGLLVICALWLSFRSFRVIGISLLLIGMSDLGALAVLQLTGATLNVLTVTVPAMVAIVSMSDLVHVFSRYAETDPEKTILARISKTYDGLRGSLLLTSVTTSIGFLMMVFTDVGPFVHFGIATSAGILMAYLLTVYVLPVLLPYVQTMRSAGKWVSQKKVSHFFGQVSGVITVVGALMLVASVYFGSQVKFNTFLFEDLDAKDPLSKSLSFFEENFFGIRNLELFVEVADGRDVFTTEVIRELEPLQQFLEQAYGKGNVYSPLTLIKRYNRIYYGGLPERFEIPGRPKALDRIVRFLGDKAQSKLTDDVVAEEAGMMRFFVKSVDGGSKVAETGRNQLRQFSAENIDNQLLKIRISGRPLFVDRQNEQMTIYLLKSLLVALLIVFLIILLVYRSWRLAAIALIPNLMPMLVMLAIMYFMEITLKQSTAVVFTIAFGIAVDDTLHFISRWRNLMSADIPLKEAVSHTWCTTGRAILITSLILMAGFGSFVFSSFHSTFLTGTLTSAALFAALIADLIVLPALLLRFYKERRN